MAEGGPRALQLASETDLAGFRQAARAALAAGLGPQQLSWHVATAAETDLFGPEAISGASNGASTGPSAEAPTESPTERTTETSGEPSAQPPTKPAAADTAAPPSPAPRVNVPAFFPPLCDMAALHTDPGRFGLLYRLLWRLVHEPGLRHDPLDADRMAAEQLARAVKRDMHKMTAFVRFRPLAPAGEDEAAGEPAQRWHVAWFEPEHHIVEATAPFFTRRFAQMRWAILTPERCVRWDGQRLSFGPGARRDEAPPADAGEQLWLTYYEHIFNPARLKLKAMQKEMPRRYWHNLPEAVLIHPLTVASAQRSGRMVEQVARPPVHRRPAVSLALRLSPAVQPGPSDRTTDTAALETEEGPATATLPASRATESPATLAALHQATERCRDCPIGELATQAVNGTGPLRAPLMLVGEQPGDQEDLHGQPFVGPAGQLLDRALMQLGWPRETLYITNAVKHFKYELRGKRRIHKSPAQREIAACLHWLESEIALVAPQAVVALGATAARALLGRAVGVTSERGHWLERDDGLKVLVTLHPSALLRMEPDEKEAAYQRWLQDLRRAAPWGRPPSSAG